LKSRFTNLKTFPGIIPAVFAVTTNRTFFQMIREIIRGKYRMSFLSNILVISGIVYILSPLDFDWIPFFGWIDDGIVMYFLCQRLKKEKGRYNRLKAMGRRLHQGREADYSST
jgi:uncharacterized membrane protein YkvA (DUF1232 family)